MSFCAHILFNDQARQVVDFYWFDYSMLIIDVFLSCCKGLPLPAMNGWLSSIRLRWKARNPPPTQLRSRLKTNFLRNKNCRDCETEQCLAFQPAQLISGSSFETSPDVAAHKATSTRTTLLFFSLSFQLFLESAFHSHFTTFLLYLKLISLSVSAQLKKRRCQLWQTVAVKTMEPPVIRVMF